MIARGVIGGSEKSEPVYQQLNLASFARDFRLVPRGVALCIVGFANEVALSEQHRFGLCRHRFFQKQRAGSPTHALSKRRGRDASPTTGSFEAALCRHRLFRNGADGLRRYSFFRKRARLRQYRFFRNDARARRHMLFRSGAVGLCLHSLCAVCTPSTPQLDQPVTEVRGKGMIT